MNQQNFGMTLKRIRKLKGYSKEALADGICSRKYVHLIEKGERMPSAHILGLFSVRLNEDLYKYVLLSMHDDPMFVSELMTTIDIAREQREIKILTENLERLDDLGLSDHYINQFILWHKAICAQYDNDYQLALSYCCKALNYSKKEKINLKKIIKLLQKRCLPQLEYDILNTVVHLAFYSDNKRISIELVSAILKNAMMFSEAFQDKPAYRKTLRNLISFLIREQEYWQSSFYFKEMQYFGNNDISTGCGNIIHERIREMISLIDNMLSGDTRNHSYFKVTRVIYL